MSYNAIRIERCFRGFEVSKKKTKDQPRWRISFFVQDIARHGQDIGTSASHSGRLVLKPRPATDGLLVIFPVVS
jgi:hypothetical protein